MQLPQLPQPRQPPQCEWSAAAVRMHLPAALARPAQTDRSCRNQGSRRSANGAGCCPRRRSANAPARCPRSTCSDRPQLPQPRQPPQCEWSWLLPSLPQCEWSWLLPSPLQCECNCLLPPPQCEWSPPHCPLPLLDLLRQTIAAALAAAVRMHLPAALARPAQTDRRSAAKAASAVRMERLHSPPQCGRSANAPACCPHRSANGAAVAPRPRQPPQCEWSGCTRRRSAAAVRMHLPAAPTAVRMEPPSLRDQGSHRSANGAAALAAAVRPQCECTCLLPPPQCEWSRRRSATKAATAVRMERLHS